MLAQSCRAAPLRANPQNKGRRICFFYHEGARRFGFDFALEKPNLTADELKGWIKP